MNLNVTEEQLEAIKALLIQGKTPKTISRLLGIKNTQWIIVYNGLERYIKYRSSISITTIRKYENSKLTIREIARREQVTPDLIYNKLRKLPELREKMLEQGGTGQKVRDIKRYKELNPNCTNKDICNHFGFTRQYLNNLRNQNKL